MSSRLTPRDDLRALGGYHSPQLDVPVRLNTNESPYSPPPEFVDAWLEALRAAPLNRYPDRAADFTVDPSAALAFLKEHRPALVFLCSPNNPTGTVEPSGTVEAIVDATDGLLVVDEAYGEFAEHSAIELVADDRPLVVARTYSKVWSMAALRLGFCVAPPWVVEELEKVVLPYHLTVPTQLAGVLALRYGSEMDQRVALLVRERERLRAELGAVDGVTVFPSGANFVLLRVHGDGHALWQRLVDRGVLVRDFSGWPRLADCLRITVGTPEENDTFLAALREAVEEVRVA